jgi:hypothetical protein
VNVQTTGRLRNDVEGLIANVVEACDNAVDAGIADDQRNGSRSRDPSEGEGFTIFAAQGSGKVGRTDNVTKCAVLNDKSSDGLGLVGPGRCHVGDACFDERSKVAARKLKASDPGGSSSLKVGNFVPDQEATQGIDRPTPDQIQDHAGRRIPPLRDARVLWNGAFWMKRAIPDVVNPRSAGLELVRIQSCSNCTCDSV